MTYSIKRSLLCLLAATACNTFAQQKVTHEGSPALKLSSGKADLLILPQGGAFVSFTLASGPHKINPMWDPVRMAREKGAPQNFGASMGHFLCVDGFGPTSREERAAGYEGHGEAHRLPWDVLQSSDSSITFRVKLPKVQEVLTRKITMAPGEQVALVESELESQLPFDRVILWGEHATLGPPFLKLGKTIVDASSTQCQTKPYSGPAGNRTFPSGKNFLWPTVPSSTGTFNARLAPTSSGAMNHIGCLMDPKRQHEFITAIDTEDKLLFGYLFPRADYPWVQHWMNYPTNGQYAWGLEFGMQPYDMTKQEILALTPLFGEPTFRWLPAKSKVATKFLFFLTPVPDGFNHVKDVRLEGGNLIIEDTKGKKVTLPASRTF